MPATQAIDSITAESERPGLFGRRLRPHSITGLVIASFAVVATPLIVAIVASVFYVEKLHAQSEQLVIQGVAVTRDAKRLTSLFIDMERSARQYRILDHADVRARFKTEADAYRQQLAQLAGLNLPTLSTARLDALGKRVAALPARLDDGQAGTDAVINTLDDIRNANTQIGNRGTEFVHQQLAALRATAARAHRLLLICVFALVPVVILLSLYLTYVITRPLRQILNAINHLATGELSDEVRVVAPVVELDRLGDRLDWMRRCLAIQENEKQQFLRHMSHELKTPLASIREGAELLTDGSLGQLAPAQREVADIIGRNSLELVSLIDNLFRFAAWREQHARLEISRFDLAALIERVCGRHQLAVRARNLQIERPAGPAWIAADLDRMQLIVDNLLANAVKYARTGGRVVLRIEQQPEATDLYVADDGPGVAPADRAHIFDAFVRGENPPPEPTGVSGTGIGLSIVRDSARAHGGDAAYTSNKEFASVFHVRIPVPDTRT